MSVFEWIRLDWMSLGPAAVECIGSYFDRLALHTTAPLFFIFIVVTVTVGIEARKALRAEKEAAERTPRQKLAVGVLAAGYRRSLPIALPLLFAFLPSVASRTFNAFDCDPYNHDPDHVWTFLHDSLAIQCFPLTPEYAHIRGLAWALVIFWPGELSCGEVQTAAVSNNF